MKAKPYASVSRLAPSDVMAISRSIPKIRETSVMTATVFAELKK
jgi:hypothetical protein